MLQLKIKAGRRHIPIFDLPAAVGRKAAYEEIGDQVDALIAFLDDLQGDVDLEDGGDDEPDTDAMGDQSWPEWHTLPAHQRRTGNSRGRATQNASPFNYEDDEDSDPTEDDDSDRDASGDDWIAAGNLNCGGMLYPGQDKEAGVSDDDEESHQPAYNGPLATLAERQAANDA